MKKSPSAYTNPTSARENLRQRFTIEPLEARIAPAANIWIGGTSGNWGDALNWSDGVPTADDDVTIDPVGVLTITIQTGAQVANSLMMPGDDTLAISGGSLTLTSASSVGNLSLSVGTLNAGPQLTLTGAGLFSGDATINGLVRNQGTLSIAGAPNLIGTIDNAGTLINRGQVDFGVAGLINNLSTGVLEMAKVGGGDVTGGATTVPGIVNSGIVRLTEAGVSTITIPFGNLTGGIIEVTAGTLSLEANGIWEGGSFLINAGSEVTLNAGNKTWTGSYTGSGGGILRLGGGVQGFSGGGTVTVGAAGATFNFPAGFFIFSGNAVLTGGAVSNLGEMSFADRPDLRVSIENAGKLINRGQIDFGVAGLINNLGTGVLEIAKVGGGDVTGGATTVPGIINSGVVRLTEAAVSTVTVPFGNLTGGIIEVTAGTLAFNADGIWEGGSFLISAGSEVTLNAGNKTWTGDYTGSGGGVLRLGGGVQGFGGGGTVAVGAAGATFNFPAGFFIFSGNAVLTGGAVNNLGEIAFADRPDLRVSLSNSGKLINRGQIDFGAAGLIDNLPTGVLEIAKVGGGDLTAGATTVPGIVNSGIVRLTEAAVSAFTVPFGNLAGGIIEVTAGTLAFDADGVWEGGSFLINTGSEVTLNAGNKTWTGSYTGSGGGVLRLGGGVQGFGGGGTVTVDAAGATFNFPAGFFIFSGNAVLTGGAVNNLGEIAFADRPDLRVSLSNSGKLINRGQIDFGVTGLINNLGTGVLEIAKVGGGDVTGGATTVPGIVNSGIVRLTEAAVSTITVPFGNLSGGIIEVTAGTLAVDSDGMWEGGSFVISVGSEVTLNAGNKMWTGTYTGSGGGILRLGGGVQGFSGGGTVTVGAAGATFNFPAGFFIFSGNAVLTGGAVSNLGEMAFADRPDLRVSIDNAGKLINRGQIDFGVAALINNLSTGVLEMAKVGGGDVTAGATTVPGIVNSGIVRLTEAGVSTLTVPFGNLAGGIIEVTAGTLAFDAGGLWEGGSFLINTGSEVTLNAGNKTWTGSFTGSGGGILRLGGGVQGFSGGGTITVGIGGATFDFPVGFFQFSGNASLTGGTLTNNGDITMADRPNLGLTIDNAGTLLNFAGIDFTGTGRINNLEGGTFTISNVADGTFAGGSTASPGIFNAGKLVLASSADLATGLPFSNTGLVQVTAGTLRFTGAVAEIINSELTAGTWEVFNGASLLITRTFATNSAELILHGTGVIGGLAANLTTNAGSIQLLEGATLSLARAFANNGELVVGSASLLATALNFTQTATGRIEFELGGPPDGGQFGRLAIGGAADLNGRAIFTLTNDFIPEIGQSFPLATFGSRTGAFATYDGTILGRDLFLSPALTDASLVVNAVESPANAKIADKKRVVTFTDADGDTIRITVKGGGSAEVGLLGEAIDNADIAFIDISEATSKTRLDIAVVGQRGDGIVNTGILFASGTGIKSISIKGDLGLLDATALDLGKVNVSGQLGRILAGDGDPKKPAIKKLTVGSLGTTEILPEPLLSTIDGSLLKLKVKRDVVGAAVDVLGTLGRTNIGGNLVGQIDTGAILLASIMERGFADPRVTGGLPFGAFNAEGVGKFSVAGNVAGGSVTSAGDISSVSIGQDLHAGAVTAGGQIKNVKVLGAMSGEDAANPSVVAALAKVGSTKPADAVAIDALQVKGDVSNAQVLLGFRKVSGDFSRPVVPANPDASAGKVVVKGDWSASSLVAGVFDATGDGFGQNDATISGDTTPDIFARIASVVIKGTVTGSANPDEHYAITAQQIGKLSINNEKIPLNKDTPDDIQLDPVNGNFRLVEVAAPVGKS
jgi:hypothetical protein